MTVLLAGISAVFYGFSDFLGGIASREESPYRVAAVQQIVGLPIVALAVILAPVLIPGLAGAFSPTSLLVGVIAGSASGIGVLSLFAGFATGRISLVAPITAAVGASLPVVFDLARGQQVSTTSLFAIALALVAIIIVSVSPDEDAAPGAFRQAVMLAVLSGVGFAGSYIALSLGGADAGLWPVVGARTASSVVVGALALMSTRGLTLAAKTRPTVIRAGILDTSANITILLAIQHGPLSIASVIGSLYPVITVTLAHFVLGERLDKAQSLGIALAMAAVILATL